ncbi:MAG: D-glycero-beta-D-manno-heptose 1,7-bisphosphate 7-phosphatase [Chloroflexota bacterium]
MKAVFLDRDGVINENRSDHVKDWSEFRFLPGTPEAIARLSRTGVRIFVITNQAIINRGVVSRQQVDAINRRMVREIENRGGRIDEVVYCPHHPDEACDCRKPRPGLLLSLARKHRLDLSDTALIGDALTDIEAGLSVGCDAILVLTGRGRDQLAQAVAAGKNGFRIASDLSEAVDLLTRRAPTDRQSQEGVSAKEAMPQLNWGTDRGEIGE